MSTRIPRLRTEIDKKDLGAASVGDKFKSPQKRPNRPPSAKNGRKVEKAETKALPDKKSPLREVNVNRYRSQQPHLAKQTKTSLQDRRGISEIKRSEQNLRVKLETMEHEVESFKHELYEVKREMEETNLELEERQINESSLKENIEQLRRRNVAQSVALEQRGHDPVLLGLLSPTEKLDNLVTSSGENGKNFAVELRSRMTETERSLDEILTRLKTPC